MTKQGHLFGPVEQTAYGATHVPLAAQADPQTSHEAGRRHKASGVLDGHAAIATDLVRQHPGRTFHELFQMATDEQRRELGTPEELCRRLGGMRRWQMRWRTWLKSPYAWKRSVVARDRGSGPMVVTWEVGDE